MKCEKWIYLISQSSNWDIYIVSKGVMVLTNQFQKRIKAILSILQNVWRISKRRNKTHTGVQKLRRVYRCQLHLLHGHKALASKELKYLIQVQGLQVNKNRNNETFLMSPKYHNNPYPLSPHYGRIYRLSKKNGGLLAYYKGSDSWYFISVF